MAQVAGVLPDDLATKIKNSKVLVVGAGGIGCEILKNLVMSGFPDIEIIDLDTIDVSNLNRQFLFHKEHVGKSKAEVARQSALNFNPNTNIKAYHDSVTSTNYGVNFFKRFDVVLNALDNRQARNHVNRMCLTADVPLIESGTSGYDGQIELIKKDLTMCYECTPKAPQKSFPGCTIRNTPSEPIHCIVWAKHLFNQLFGEDIEDQDVSPDTTDPEAAGEAGKEAMATNANEQGNVERVKTKDWARDVQYDPEKLFNKFFCDDIKYLLSMSDLWKKRTPPNPLQWNEITNNSTDCDNGGITRDQKIWTITECAKYFSEAITSLKLSALKLSEGDFLVWDKDDRDAMDFVAACANIRANIFGIPQKSCFEIKSMAGNIIPAIATTNAITAGFVVLHAFKVLEGKFDQCRTVYMKLRPNARNQLFIPEKFLNRPNPQCYVCAPNPSVTLTVDTSKMTVKTLRDEVLIKALNMISPDVTLESKGLIVISSDGDETECNNDKKLNEMQIVDGCILTVDDFFQNYTLVVTIVHKEVERDEAPFELSADPSTLKPQEPTEDITTATDEPETKKRKIDETVSDVKVEDGDDDCAIVEDDDDCCIVDTKNNSNDGASCSNHSAVEDVGEPSSKRIRLASSSSDDCVVLD